MDQSCCENFHTNTNVSTIREVFDYIRRFKNHLFVLKIEDNLFKESLFTTFIKDLVRLHEAGIKLIVIPGTRNTINRNLKNANIDTKFIN